MSSHEYIHIEDWNLIGATPKALKVDNDEPPFLEGYNINPKHRVEWLPREFAEMREDDELWVMEWLAIEKGLI